MKEDAARPGWIASGGKLRDVKRPACFSVADRRVSKLRPWLRVSRAAGMRNRSERKTHSDQLAWEEAQGALRSRCPADEAINLSHRTNAQRMEQSTPARRTGVLRVKDQRQTSPDGRGPRTKDQCQLRRFGPCWLRRTNVKLRIASIPSWETLRSTRATGITHPGFYGRKPWRKPNSAFIITATETRCEDFSPLAAKIVQSSP